jgi:D-alanyl-D-alanine carboxypeptidase/D-alanyl-D-alanine-endopeptidase (penicillin-binding protein 4)
MPRRFIITVFLLNTVIAAGQQQAAQILLNDSSMIHASASIKIMNAENGVTIFEYDPDKCLMPASVQKLITSAAALELLGPEFCFRTGLGYTGYLNSMKGLLTGNIIIAGGGDPALGSLYFKDHYRNFLKTWITDIKNLGIKKIEGKVIADDSRYDFQPVPAKWLWEDMGNYYGAGVYGLSVFDNMYEIHFRTSEEGSIPLITKFVPDVCRNLYPIFLTASGNSDNGYVFAAPYNKYGWLSGTIPVNTADFTLKASVSDPPLLIAEIFDYMLDSAGIEVTEDPSTTRLDGMISSTERVTIAEVVSPPLKKIVEVLNHESVNLYAEHLIKEMSEVYGNNGTEAAGINIVKGFLATSGVNTGGIILEDGSGMSPLNAISSGGLAELLLFMRTKGKHFNEFYASLPDAGKEGTLKNYFRDKVFESNLRAKSGSMTRVRSYAGYFKTMSGNEMVFSIIINNYCGPSSKIIKGIEEILKETILYN